MKAQSSFFIRVLFIVILIILFFSVVFIIENFRKITTEEKIKMEFRMNVINTLQKLLTSKECLAYEYNLTSKKPVVDKNKLDFFSKNYVDKEPDCAKAVDFDYNITVIQFEKEFTVYPGFKKIKGDEVTASDFAQHVCKYDENNVLFVRCNWNPRELEEEGKDPCLGRGELDPPGGVPICEDRCYPDPLEKCPYKEGNSPCCIVYACPEKHCTCEETADNYHKYIVSCSKEETNDFTICRKLPGAHSFCGKIVRYIEVPIGEPKEVKIENKIASFGLVSISGMSQFSPEKAKKGEIEISVPVTIRYNETFSAEGIIKIYAVKGELEEFFGFLEEVCSRAERGEGFDSSKSFYFSYSVELKSDKKICMLDSCKKFYCSFDLEMNKIERGEHLLIFSVDHSSKKIIVKE